MTLAVPEITNPLHANCVAIGDEAVLLIGKSGAGKSDLALRLIDRGAQLISDDYTQWEWNDTAQAVLASPPAIIAGKIEVRGLGILSLPHRSALPVRLAVVLVSNGCDPAIERLPLQQMTIDLGGHPIPCIRLNGFEASAPIRIEYALNALSMPGSIVTGEYDA